MTDKKAMFDSNLRNSITTLVFVFAIIAFAKFACVHCDFISQGSRIELQYVNSEEPIQYDTLVQKFQEQEGFRNFVNKTTDDHSQSNDSKHSNDNSCIAFANRSSEFEVSFKNNSDFSTTLINHGIFIYNTWIGNNHIVMTCLFLIIIAIAMVFSSACMRISLSSIHTMAILASKRKRIFQYLKAQYLTLYFHVIFTVVVSSCFAMFLERFYANTPCNMCVEFLLNNLLYLAFRITFFLISWRYIKLL
jgi:hypothetical protein